MVKFYYIVDEHNSLIEFFRESSARYFLIKSLVSKRFSFSDNEEIVISKEKLFIKIKRLLNSRVDNNQLDKGMFDSENCFRDIYFNGQKYHLETSGDDSLIIFAINIYSNINSSLFLKIKL